MAATALTERARAAWAGLASTPVSFGPAVRVAVSTESDLCPPGWAGLVVIEGAVIATAPDPRTAAAVQQALSGVPAASASDVGLLTSRLDIVGMLGPAALAYLDQADFRPRHDKAVIERLGGRDAALQRFLAAADDQDLAESGMGHITSGAFVIRECGQVAAAAGYRDWPGQIAHLSVLTAASVRRRGLGTAAASAAVGHALARGRLPQWRARPPASRRIAANLGFRELGCQVSIRLQECTNQTASTGGAP